MRLNIPLFFCLVVVCFFKKIKLWRGLQTWIKYGTGIFVPILRRSHDTWRHYPTCQIVRKRRRDKDYKWMIRLKRCPLDVTSLPWDVTKVQIWLQVLVMRIKAERENPAGFPKSDVMKKGIWENFVRKNGKICIETRNASVFKCVWLRYERPQEWTKQFVWLSVKFLRLTYPLGT